MGYQPGHILTRQVVLLHDLFGDIGHRFSGSSEYGSALLFQKVHPLPDCLLRGGKTAAAALLIELTLLISFRMIDKIDNTGLIIRWFKQHGTRRITEQNTGGTIGIINDGAHLVSSRSEEHTSELQSRGH